MPEDEKYSRQIALGFIGQPNNLLALKNRVDNKNIGQPIEIMSDTKKREPSDNKQRIYINIHGNDRSNFFVDLNGKKHQPSDIAKFLKRKLLDDLENQQLGVLNQRPKIVLVSCFGGKSDKGVLKSKAAQLQKELEKLGVYADINAYTKPVRIDIEDGKKKTVALNKIEEYQLNLKILGLLKKQLNEKKDSKPITDSYKKTLQQLKDSSDYQKQDSKIALRWTTDKKQVAYNAYPLKEHEKIYHQIKEMIAELKSAAEELKKENQHTLGDQIKQLAEAIEYTTDSYFNGSDKNLNETQTFKEVYKKLLDKIAHLINSEYKTNNSKTIKNALSQGIFSNKTDQGKRPDNSSNTLPDIESIQPIKKIY